MPKKNKNSLSLRWIILIIATAIAGLGLLISSLVVDKNIALFSPKGHIAQQQYELMMFTIGVLLAIFIPVLTFAYFVAYKYRESNTKVTASTSAIRNKSTVAGIWLVPITIMVILASVMIPATHELAPQKSIKSDKKPLTIQVISLRWKWLFLYPEQGIATVNFVQMPIDTPVVFEMTADETPMSSFWIPNLGGQLYTMTSHVNRLNLMADAPGDYPGSTPEINGAGFTGMKFTARASTEAEFDQWVTSVQQSPKELDKDEYKDLLKPSKNNPVVLFSGYQDGLYDKVIAKYTGSAEGHAH